MNTNMTGLRGFSCALDESSLSIGRVNSIMARQHPLIPREGKAFYGGFVVYYSDSRKANSRKKIASENIRREGNKGRGCQKPSDECDLHGPLHFHLAQFYTKIFEMLNPFSPGVDT